MVILFRRFLKCLVKISALIPGHWPRLSIVQIFRQNNLRTFHDPEFQIFGLIKDCQGTFIDIGANQGQTAISILANTDDLKVQSYEPNPTHWLPLMVVKLIYPRRFKFKIMALGEIEGSTVLNIPNHARFDLSGSASLKPEALNKEYVRERFREETKQSNPKVEIREKEISVKKLDNLNLVPDVIKIDVEGFEGEVLTGALKTIIAHKPVLFIEINSPDSWMPLLDSLGYSFFRADGSQAKSLGRVDQLGGFINLIGLHPLSKSVVSRKLLASCD